MSYGNRQNSGLNAACVSRSKPKGRSL